MKTIAKTLPTTNPGWHWPLLMAFVRLPFILAGNGLARSVQPSGHEPDGLLLIGSAQMLLEASVRAVQVSYSARQVSDTRRRYPGKSRAAPFGCAEQGANLLTAF
jgi:hypothetical protein